MFKRVIIEEWTTWTPYVGFWLTFIVFMYCSVKAVLMKRTEADRLASMPLEDETL